MASHKLNPSFGYVVVYVKDVARSLDFYSKAFGYTVRRHDESLGWGELDTGHTTVGFTPIHQRETDELTGQVRIPQSDQERNAVQVLFAYQDVDAAFKRAVENGAVAVSKPEKKPWGQKVGYVRDIDGIVVGIGSFVARPE